jgi:nucleoside diphosphate kinase
MLGTDSRLNAIFGSSNSEAAEREIKLLFGANSKAFTLPLEDSELAPTSTAPQKTVALIKPDIVQAGKVEEIIEKIICRGFTISAREEFVLNTDTARELYQQYRDESFFEDTINFITRY